MSSYGLGGKMKYPNNVKFSIITVSYNSEKTIRDTLESIKNQNYNNLEYIIIDGGSSDNTLKIVSEFQDVVTQIVSEPDNGISDAMNKGIRLASGDIIGIIHSDDMLYENALEKILLAYDESIDVYYGDCVVCNQEGEKLHILKAKQDLSDMCYSFGMIHPSTFITRRAYEKWGSYCIKCKYAMDYELLLRFYKNNVKMKYLDSILAVYRLGGINQKNRKKTILEVRDISIYHGGSPIKAEFIRLEKVIKDFLRPYIHIKSKRIKSYG